MGLLVVGYAAYPVRLCPSKHSPNRLNITILRLVSRSRLPHDCFSATLPCRGAVIVSGHAYTMPAPERARRRASST